LEVDKFDDLVRENLKQFQKNPLVEIKNWMNMFTL
jgi:hypothetical protein